MITVETGAQWPDPAVQAALRQITPSPRPVPQQSGPDLGFEFAVWGDESLDWASAALGAQVEVWPVE